MRKYVYPSGIRTTSPQNLSLHVHSTQLSIDIVCSKSSKHLCNVFSLVWLHSKDKTSYGFATRNTSPHEWEVNLHNPVKLREIVRFPHLSYPCFKALTPYSYDTEFAHWISPPHLQGEDLAIIMRIPSIKGLNRLYPGERNRKLGPFGDRNNVHGLGQSCVNSNWREHHQRLIGAMLTIKSQTSGDFCTLLRITLSL